MTKTQSDTEHDHVPDYIYGVIYIIERPSGGNPDGS